MRDASCRGPERDDAQLRRRRARAGTRARPRRRRQLRPRDRARRPRVRGRELARRVRPRVRGPGMKKANRAFELIVSRGGIEPAFMADRERLDRIEVVSIDDGEVVLFWELSAKEAVRLLRE